MLKESTNNQLEYQRLSQDEMQQRGILGRLVGVCADFFSPTRNGRKYPEELWENVFSDPIMKERIENGVCYGELGHPADREETDMEKIALCLAEVPKKGKDGKLRAVFDILNTPNGRILKSLCDYGSTIGISSRGSGDLETDYDGNESVNPDTYNCEGFDAVLIPAVKEARLQYVTESLNKKRYNKTLRDKLTESINKEDENNQKIMRESLNTLGIQLNEWYTGEPDSYELGQAISSNTIKPGLTKAHVAKGIDLIKSEPSRNGNVYTYTFNSSLGDVIVTDSVENLSKRVSKISVGGKELDLHKLPYPYDSLWSKNHSVLNVYDLIKDIESGKISKEELTLNESLNEGNTKPWNDEYKGFKIVLDNQSASYNIYNEDDELEDSGFMSKEAAKEWIDEYTSMYESLNEGLNTYPIEYSYTQEDDNNVERFYGHINIKANSEEEAIEKADSYLHSTEFENKNIDITDISDIHIGDTEYTNVDMIEELDNEEETPAADNDGALVEQLQNILSENEKLKKQIIELQEKLSVCYAKETHLTEANMRRNDTISKLSNQTKKTKALNEKYNSLEAQFNKNLNIMSKDRLKIKILEDNSTSLKKTNSKLAEDLKVKSNEISKLNKKINVLENKSNKINDKHTKQIASMNEQLENSNKDLEQLKENYTRKLESTNKLVEKYKKMAKNAVNKYIDSQATKLGIDPIQIKKRLGESYTFSDIDRICEELQDYSLNMSSLPFSTKANLNENVQVRAKNINHNNITPCNPDDDITDYDLKIAGLV